MKIIFLNLLFLFSLNVNAQNFVDIKFYGAIAESACTISAVDEIVQIKLTSSCQSKDNKSLITNYNISKKIEKFEELLPDNKGVFTVTTIRNNPNKKLVVIDYL